MCKRGGLILEEPGEEPDVKVGDPEIRLAKMYDGNNWVEVDNLKVGDEIDVFDADLPLGGPPNEKGPNNEKVCVLYRNPNSSSISYVTVGLGIKQGGTCTGTYALQHGYDGSVSHDELLDKDWDFEIGKSAGVC